MTPTLKYLDDFAGLLASQIEKDEAKKEEAKANRPHGLDTLLRDMAGYHSRNLEERLEFTEALRDTIATYEEDHHPEALAMGALTLGIVLAASLAPGTLSKLAGIYREHLPKKEESTSG